MEIRQLRYFIAVADTLSFSRAAESVYLSQSALSRQISELEKEVGVPLLRRTTRQVELTEAGKALQLYAKELISRWEKMIPEVRNRAGKDILALTLTIGTDARAMAETERRIKLVELLYGIRRENPGLRILLRNTGYEEIINGLKDGSLDCGLILDREKEHRAGILHENYLTEEMVLVFRSENAHMDGDHADVIMNRGLILVDQEPQGLYHIIHILSDLKLEPQLRFCETLEDMTMTVETGESAAILPQSVVKRLGNPNLQVLRLPSEYAKLQFSLLWSKDSENPLLPELRRGMREAVSKD